MKINDPIPVLGMLNSFNSGAFQISCLRFLNTFVETASDYRERVHIQAELEEAGLDIPHLKKLLSKVRNLQQEIRSCRGLTVSSIYILFYSLETRATF